MDSTELQNNNANDSIIVLRATTKTVISSLLNPLKLIRNDKGVPRDWQGLAELCGISGELIPSISHDKDPTAKILKLWYDQSKTNATIDTLINHLEQLDRPDVVDDILPLIAEDLKFYKEHPSNGKAVGSIDLDTDKYILTRDDVDRVSIGLEPQFYDAFVLFAEDDIDFATELLDTMERTYNLKLCVKERDLVGGACEHDAVIKLIAERCGRLIVIITPAFLESNANKFFYSLAQSISIEQRKRKIIPCIYKQCGKLPPELDCYFKLDYRRSGPFWNFWDRLHQSIKIPPQREERSASDSEQSASQQVLSSEGLKSSMHKGTNSLRDMHVKFSNSMSNLPNVVVPDEPIAPSTSENDLGTYEQKSVRKTDSFLKRIKRLVSKSEKNLHNDQPESYKPEDKNSEEYAPEKSEEKSTTDDNVIKNEEIKGEKKAKKNKLSLKRFRKKELVCT